MGYFNHYPKTYCYVLIYTNLLNHRLKVYQKCLILVSLANPFSEKETLIIDLLEDNRCPDVQLSSPFSLYKAYCFFVRMGFTFAMCNHTVGRCC